MRRMLVVLALAFPLVAFADEAWIGLQLAPGKQGGVSVRGVYDDSPGAGARIAAGDEVLAIDGAPVARPEDLIARVRQAGVGGHVKLALADARGRRTVDVTLAAR